MKKKQNQDAFAPEKSFKETFKEMTSAKAFRLGGYSAVSIIVVLVIAVVLNLAVGKLPSSITKLDMSADKLTTISQQTKDKVSALEQDVTIYWIVQEGNEDPATEQLLSRYVDLSSHVKIQKKDPVVNPNFASQYTSEQIYNNSLVVESGERSKYVAYPDIYVTDYSQYYTTGQTSTTFDGEGQITSAIDYVTSEKVPTMYVLDGHGKAEMDVNLVSMISKQNIEVTPLNLLSKDKVPEDCGTLLIYAPETDLTKDEAKTVTEYLKTGGKLLLVSGYTEKELPNLMGVMEYYGAALKQGIVFEGDASNYYQMPYLTLPKIGEHEITAPISTGYYVLYPESQAIDTNLERPDTVTVTPLLSTSDKAYIKLNVTNLETLEKQKGDEVGSFTTAVAISDSATKAQVVWLTSTLFTQKVYDQVVGGTNTDLFLNSVNWMCKSESDITIHAKTITNEHLTVSASASALLSVVIVALLPLAFIVIGIYVAVSRKKR